MKVTLLGTGTSTGVPVIGCCCRVCRSKDPRDNRTRSAAYVEAGNVGIVIDTGPDFRQQALRENISRVDAVLFSHAHFDHVAGVDDLRPFLFENSNSIPCYSHPGTAEVLRNMFGYIFADRTYPGVANLSLIPVDGPFNIQSRSNEDHAVRIIPIDVYHGKLPIYGYRIGRFAYLTDTSHIPEHSYDQLKDLDVLVLDALRHEPHPTHLTIADAIGIARDIGARQTYFTHLTHTVLHAEEEERLPEGIALGYDGLTFHVRG